MGLEGAGVYPPPPEFLRRQADSGSRLNMQNNLQLESHSGWLLHFFHPAGWMSSKNDSVALFVPMGLVGANFSLDSATGTQNDKP